MKKKETKNLFLSTFLASGNFFWIKMAIILQMHFMEYGNKPELFNKFSNIILIISIICKNPT